MKAFAREAGRDPGRLRSTNQLAIYVGRSREETAADMRQWLQTEWDTAGWSESTIEHAVHGSPAECAEQLRAHVGTGVDRLILIPYRYRPEQVERVATEVLAKAMSTYIDINCDMGESYGRWTLGQDEEVMPHITSANVACGFHGGDPHVMRRTVALAQRYGVAVGAHPGLPDLMGFGRRRMEVTADELKDYHRYQIGALDAFCRAAGTRLQHVKPHGIQYHMFEENLRWVAPPPSRCSSSTATSS